LSRSTRRPCRPLPCSRQPADTPDHSAQFGDNLYGTSKATIEEQSAKGKTVVLDIEVEGVKQIKASGFPARYVFIAPPSEEELEKRLRGRGTEKEESIQKRLDRAKVELEYSKVPGVHDRIIVNDVSHPLGDSLAHGFANVEQDLEKAYKELEEFVFAEPAASA
jgi:guanylate kinase